MSKILMVCPGKEDGTNFYRAWGPYSRLGHELVEFKGEIGWANLLDIDVALVQRPADQYFVNVIEHLQELHIPVIVDFDDNGWDLDPVNPAYDFFNKEEKQIAMEACINLADIVTVSTEGLRDVVLEHCNPKRLVVVENAVDDKIFHVEPSYHVRNKIIMLRGGSSHVKDWEMYKDGILGILDDFPDYKLAVMGYNPLWLRQVRPEQLMLFDFTDIPKYFQTLMELKPKLAIVPLEDTKFNRSKSAIGLFEGVLAGAAVMASDLPEFREYGACLFGDSNDLRSAAKDILEGFSWDYYYQFQMEHLPHLSWVNEKRKDIIESLINRRNKFAPHTKEIKPATALEFHNHEISHGYSQDCADHVALNKKVANWIIDTIDPLTAFELGCGTGGVLLELLKKSVVAYGFEYNPHSVEYFKSHYPVFANQVFLADITKEPIENEGIGDLVYSIEVFEHINMSEEWWVEFLTDLSKKFRNFYFSSTPFYSRESFDTYWQHINIRTTTQWIKLFESAGWEFSLQPKVVTSWDLLFKSKNLPK